MDIIRFQSSAPGKLDNGEVINNLKSKMWVERYKGDGEFKIVANVDSGARDKLPVGSFITHKDSTTAMIIEDHQLEVKRGQRPIVTITGSEYPVLLHNRVVDANKDYTVNNLTDRRVLPNTPWYQAWFLISLLIDNTSLVYPTDEFAYMNALYASSIATRYPDAVEEWRTIPRGDLYERVMELLNLNDLGMIFWRPGNWYNVVSGSGLLQIICGYDRRSDVIFSYDAGDVESAEYLWSIKKRKDAALVTGKWVAARVDESGKTDVDKRMMHIDASDLDNQFSTAPTGTARSDILADMTQRGREALAAQNEVTLTKVEISKDHTRNRFRYQYLMGDLVTVLGEYGTSAVMKVVEHVEIEDEYGEQEYPTLKLYEGE